MEERINFELSYAVWQLIADLREQFAEIESGQNWKEETRSSTSKANRE